MKLHVVHNFTENSRVTAVSTPVWTVGNESIEKIINSTIRSATSRKKARKKERTTTITATSRKPAKEKEKTTLTAITQETTKIEREKTTLTARTPETTKIEREKTATTTRTTNKEGLYQLQKTSSKGSHKSVRYNRIIVITVNVYVENLSFGTDFTVFKRSFTYFPLQCPNTFFLLFYFYPQD